ncbi:MAG TPA: hypothetical protein VIF62_35120 [Labilithrix sp.]
MSKRHLPSIEALTSGDDESWIRELKLSEVREQVDAARTILDDLELSEGGQKASEFVQRLAALGCRFVEMADAMRRAATQRTVDDEVRREPEKHLNFLG